ncbi:glomulin-like isoform X2 [Rhopilema esculentum]|uniref:glomulin-like isoform X2 n=1 Tax=Rhopilema esculentum TaxID=499914 RepID=UPI0031D1F876
MAAESFFFGKRHLKSNPVLSDDFLDAVRQCLEENSASEVLELLCDDSFKDVIEFSGWEIISIIFPYSNFIPLKRDYHEIMERLNKVCSAKEMILGLTENLGIIASLQSLKFALDYLQKAIMRLSWKQVKLVKACCLDISKLFLQLAKSKFAEIEMRGMETDLACSNSQNSNDDSKLNNDVVVSRNLEAETRKDRSSCGVASNESDNVDEMVQKRFCCMVKIGLLFIGPFLDGKLIAGCNFDEKDIKAIAINFLCTLLVNPVSSYQIVGTCQEKTEWTQTRCIYCSQTSDSISSCIMNAFSSFKIPYTKFLETGLNIEDRVLENDAKATLSYLMLVKDIGTKYCPFVLSVEYLLKVNLEPMLQFLKRNDYQGRKKSLDLAESLLHRVREFALSLEFLDSIAACSLFQNLTEIMVSDSNQDFRNRSLHLFRFSLKRFDTPSRSILLRKLLRSIKHSGVCSLIVQCIKDEVLQLDSKLSDQSLVKKITPSFLELTYLSFDPILQHDCDIVMEAERFIAALNLLRFLLLRSAENNDKFNILANFHKMEERYLSVLQKKTEDSYAEISCHLNESRNEIKSSTSERKEDASTDCSFSLKHLELSGNIESLQLSLNTLDIIRSLLARIAELHKEILPR